MCITRWVRLGRLREAWRQLPKQYGVRKALVRPPQEGRYNMDTYTVHNGICRQQWSSQTSTAALMLST